MKQVPPPISMLAQCPKCTLIERIDVAPFTIETGAVIGGPLTLDGWFWPREVDLVCGCGWKTTFIVVTNVKRPTPFRLEALSTEKVS